MGRPSMSLHLIVSAIPAMVLVYAASSKLLSSEGNTLLWCLTWIELPVAVGLIVVPQRTAPIALSLYSGFVGLLVVLWVFGEETCNCFGVEGGNIFLSLTVDSLMISLLLLSADEHVRRRAYLLCGGMAFLGATLAPVLAEYTLITSYSGGIHVEGAIIGDVRGSSARSHRITVTNRSSKVVEVGSILPTCNCTTIDQQPFRLRPGESRSVEFTVDLHRYFPEGESAYRSRLSAGFYDPNGDLIGTPTIFSARVVRTAEFSLSSNRLYASEEGSSVSMTATPLRRAGSDERLSVRVHNPDLFAVDVVGTTAEITVNTSSQPFETSYVTVSFGGGEREAAEQTFEISVLAEPPELEFVWSDDRRELALIVEGNAVLESVDAKWVTGNSDDQLLNSRMEGNALSIRLPETQSNGVVGLDIRVDSVQWTYFLPPICEGSEDNVQP